MKSVPMTEEQLIAACRHNKPWAQKMLYEQYAPSMFSLCMRYAGNKETAKDLLQEGFIRIFTKLHTYTGSGPLGGWIRRIFVTTSLEYLRNNEALKWQVSFDDYGQEIESNDTEVLKKLSADDLLECIAELPNGFRAVFNLYAIEGYSHAEIGEMLQIKESTSRSQYTRARQLLKEQVEILLSKEKFPTENKKG